MVDQRHLFLEKIVIWWYAPFSDTTSFRWESSKLSIAHSSTNALEKKTNSGFGALVASAGFFPDTRQNFKIAIESALHLHMIHL